jgi:regulator of cell morphogenesis and NO signaling
MDKNNWSKTSLIGLVEYIEQHHCELKEKLQKLQTLLEKAAEQDKDMHGNVLISLQKFYVTFKDEMERHFKKEERILIPYIRQMDDFKKNIGPKPEFQHSSLKNPISQIEADHDQVENVMFNKLHAITDNYQLPQDASEAFKTLYDCLKDIEDNIRKHIDLEHKKLFPLAIKLELELIHKRA